MKGREGEEFHQRHQKGGREGGKKGNFFNLTVRLSVHERKGEEKKGITSHLKRGEEKKTTIILQGGKREKGGGGVSSYDFHLLRPPDMCGGEEGGKTDFWYVA